MLKHLDLGDTDAPKTLAILVPEKDLNQESLLQHYIKPLEKLGLSRNSMIAFNLVFNSKGKAPVAKIVKPHLKSLEPVIKSLGITTILCSDGSYFKPLCKVTKLEPCYGYPLDTIFEGVTAFIVPSYRHLFYNPLLKSKINFSLKALANHLQDDPGMFDTDILKNVEYLSSNREIKTKLDKLMKLPAVTIDIETYSLKIDKASLATIAIGENKNTATSFWFNYETRKLVKEFLQKYKGKAIYHNGTYDCKVLIWELFMDHPRDYKGMLEGLHACFQNYHDTKTIAYLATNTTAGNSLSLKDLAFEYTGNYAVNVTDINSLPAEVVAKYNATDAIATWYVYDKYWPIVQAEQLETYNTVFLPSLKTITCMELVGMPLNMLTVLSLEDQLDDIIRKHSKNIETHPITAKLNDLLREREAYKANQKLKKLRKTKEDFLSFEFNPNSPTQVAVLLHELMSFDVLATTDTGAPSTDAKALTAHIERLKRLEPVDESSLALLEDILALKQVSTIANTFIPAFKENSVFKDDWHYLHGSFNLGGTKSGRLSSSGPNLMNIPSTGTEYADPVKACFEAPPPCKNVPEGWLFVGVDYNSLEDMISALLTKDPAKLAVYLEGYDGHCLRTFSYFSDRMPDVVQDMGRAKTKAEKVEVINSIKERYPSLRQLSKGPTFALTYKGTWKTLVKNFGLTKEEAIQIETEYHNLYGVSDQWVKDRIIEASKTGYVELAFGLKLRTPMLPQVVITSYDSLPYETYKEIKTAGNALGQSYGLLNSHSANQFLNKVWNHEQYSTWILPCAQIHDSQYYIIRNNLNCLKWMNDELIKCVQWGDLDAIRHPTIKLGGKLEVYYPTWEKKFTLPNGANALEIHQILNG